MSQTKNNVPKNNVSKNDVRLVLLGGLLASALVAAGVMLGMGLSLAKGSDFDLLKLHASASSTGKTVSLATGLVNNGDEAVYILDHLNGNLQCWLINNRTNELGGVYRTNVLAALGGGKEGQDADLVMTTGNFEFNNRGGTIPAQSIVYVADGNTGQAAAFGFTFNKANIQRGNVEEGELTLLMSYPIRENQLREQ